jgi:hypothetical protein
LRNKRNQIDVARVVYSRVFSLQPVQAPHDEVFGPVASFHDPDGNLIELVELRYEFKPAG